MTPIPLLIGLYKILYPKIQLRFHELLAVSKKIKEKDHCNVLIFGVGYDARLWIKMNESHGRTVFLEDREEWANLRFFKNHPGVEIHKVHYTSRITQFKDLISEETSLRLDLDTSLLHERWDVIFVDAPYGYVMKDIDPISKRAIPGRMQSIYLASQLVGNGGYVFVHDSNREVESLYAETFLGKENLEFETFNGGPQKNAKLSCFKIDKGGTKNSLDANTL